MIEMIVLPRTPEQLALALAVIVIIAVLVLAVKLILSEYLGKKGAKK